MENIVPIFATIAMQSSTHPHKKAIVFGENTLSFLELETLWTRASEITSLSTELLNSRSVDSAVRPA